MSSLTLDKNKEVEALQKVISKDILLLFGKENFQIEFNNRCNSQE